MLPKTSLVACAATLFMAAPAAAQDFETVTYLGTAFFPDPVYVAGDNMVRFENEADFTVTVQATDGSWTTGPIAPQQGRDVNLDPGMTATFQTADGAAAGMLDLQNAANVETNPVTGATFVLPD